MSRHDDTLATYRPKIVVELQPDHLANIGSSVQSARALRQEYGCRSRSAMPWTIISGYPAAPPPAEKIVTGKVFLRTAVFGLRGQRGQPAVYVMESSWRRASRLDGHDNLGAIGIMLA